MSQSIKSNPKVLQEKIKHIVVLMMENRSFDNLLGWLYAYKTPPNKQEFEGLNWNLWNPLNNIDADGIPFIEKVPIEMNGQKKYSYGKEIPNPVDYTLPNPDPGEGFKDTNDQLFTFYEVAKQYPPAPINMGFVNNYQKAMLYGTLTYGDAPTNPRDIMKCYTPDQTPVLSGLAYNFAVCDHYHCSVPSQTLPNRAFMHAATSCGAVNNSPKSSCDSKTIYNQLSEAKIPWMIYGDNLMPTSEHKREEDKPGQYGKDHFSLTRLCMTQIQGEEFDANFGTMQDFKDACASGDLPAYTFLEPTYGGPNQNDQHPPTDIRSGEALMNDLYEAVKASPKVNEILFFITYDEHGGCYDHVAPPGEAESPLPEGVPGQDGFLFNRFGVRVPCVAINPYIPTGLIARPSGYTPFDHTSIIRTAQLCFGIEETLNARNEAAPDFSGLLTLDTPRTDLPSFTPQPVKAKESSDPNHVNDLHQVMGTLVKDLTGSKKPADQHLLTYIQTQYSQHFRQQDAGTKSSKTPH